MSERGVFAVDRGIFSDPDFAKEPFTEREAFMWLVSEAAWKDHSRRADGKTIKLKRGQLCHSVRFMAEAWEWSKSRVDRFLGRLENRDTIRREIGTKTQTITICNYDRFQRVSLPEWDNDGTVSGTTAGQQRDKLEDKEIQENNTTLPRESIDLEILTQKLEKAGSGKIHPHSLLVVGEMLELIAMGVSLETDIIPVVQSISSRLGRPVKLAYFVPAIREAYERRIGAVRDLPKPKPIENTDDAWSKRLNFARKRKIWSTAELGPMPGAQGCLVPEKLLVTSDGIGWTDIADSRRSAA